MLFKRKKKAAKPYGCGFGGFIVSETVEEDPEKQRDSLRGDQEVWVKPEGACPWTCKALGRGRRCVTSEPGRERVLSR